jgi:hypothetical protein
MNCTSTTRQLTAYLDGELDAATASAMRGHLRMCAACRAAAEDHAVIRDTLSGLERPEAPSPMWDGVLAQLGEAEIADAKRSRWSRFAQSWGRRVRPHLMPAGLAAAACAVVVITMQLRGDDEDTARTDAPIARSADDGGALGTMWNPAAPPAYDTIPARPPVDASIALAAEAARIDETFRRTAAELIPLARADKQGAALRRFDRDVATLEAAVVRAGAGKARERAWHSLLTFLERAALGEPTGRVAGLL